MVEGLASLIRVCHRQDGRGTEVCPALKSDEARVGRPGLLRLAFAAPLGFVVYVLVRIVLRLRLPAQDWRRGR